MTRQMLDDGFDSVTLITDVRMFTTVVSGQLAARNVKAAAAKVSTDFWRHTARHKPIGRMK